MQTSQRTLPLMLLNHLRGSKLTQLSRRMSMQMRPQVMQQMLTWPLTLMTTSSVSLLLPQIWASRLQRLDLWIMFLLTQATTVLTTLLLTQLL